MKTNLLVYTSYVSPENLEKVVEKNWLPLFIIRHIAGSELIGRYSRTAIHMPELSPSSRLYQAKRDGIITVPEFKEKYLEEIREVDINAIIRRFDILTDLTGAGAIVLMGYGPEFEACHRSALTEYLNGTGLFTNKIVEICL